MAAAQKALQVTTKNADGTTTTRDATESEVKQAAAMQATVSALSNFAKQLESTISTQAGYKANFATRMQGWKGGSNGTGLTEAAY